MISARALSAAFLALAVTISPAVGHDFQAGSITINHPWSRATPPVTPVAGGYLTLTNDGDIADRLVSISSPLSERVEIHESAVSNGVASMRPVQNGVVIGAGETVELQPGRGRGSRLVRGRQIGTVDTPHHNTNRLPQIDTPTGRRA